MELSERCIQTLEKEGLSVYETSQLPGHRRESPLSEHKTALFVTEGSLEVTINNETKILKAGDRINLPANSLYSTTAGPNGCQLVIGEME